MKYTNWILGLLLGLSVGCSDWLSVQPNDRQTEEQLFKNTGGFYAALNGVYTKLGSSPLYGNTLSWGAIDILGRRYVVPGSNVNYNALINCNYADAGVAGLFSNTWSTAYNTILNCNVLIANCEANKTGILSDRDYSVLKGEALGVRAFLHFDLLRAFGPVYSKDSTQQAIPYNTLTSGKVLPMLPAHEVTDKIIADLTQAEALLKNYDPVITEGSLSTEPTEEEQLEIMYRYRQLRFNYYAVVALKARVLLYAGRNTQALAAALQIIEAEKIKTLFPFVDQTKLLGNASTPDRVFSTETFFGLYNKDRGLVFKNNFSPEGTVSSLLQTRVNYVAQILFQNEVQDYRYMSQWGSSNAVGNTNLMFIKYQDIQDLKLFYATYFPLLRLSEVYYIAAETETDLTKAYGYLNTIRMARGVTARPVVSRADLQTKLWNEYNREFAGEGQLFFLYKRLNINIPAAENGQSTAAIGIAAYPQRVVIPYPESEIGIR